MCVYHASKYPAAETIPPPVRPRDVIAALRTDLLAQKNYMVGRVTAIDVALAELDKATPSQPDPPPHACGGASAETIPAKASR